MELPTEEQIQEQLKTHRMPVYLMAIIIAILILMRWIFGANFYAVIL